MAREGSGGLRRYGYLTTGTLIPLHLFHPRWHLGGHPVMLLSPSGPSSAAPVQRDYLESTEASAAMHEVL